MKLNRYGQFSSLCTSIALLSQIIIGADLKAGACDDLLFSDGNFVSNLSESQISGIGSQTLGGLSSVTPPSGVAECQDLIGDLIDDGGVFDNGSGVDFGTGLVESYFADVLINLPRIVKKALAELKLDSHEKSILAGIQASLPQEYKTKPLLKFAKGKAFIIDGEPKIAKTELEVGKAIYINKEMLYHNSKGIQVPAINYAMVIQILVHEFGHHQKEENHSYLSDLGAKVASVWKNESMTQLIQNGSFEKVAGQSYWPLNWGYGQQYLAYAYADPMAFARGRSSMTIKGTTQYSYGNFYQCINLPKGKKYQTVTFSSLMASAIAPYPGQFGGMAVQIFDDNNQMESYADGFNYWTPGYSHNYQNVAFGSTGFVLKRHEFMLTQKSQMACIYFYLSGYGSLWIDDVQVEFY